jgi:hypothetical protein
MTGAQTVMTEISPIEHRQEKDSLPILPRTQHPRHRPPPAPELRLLGRLTFQPLYFVYLYFFEETGRYTEYLSDFTPPPDGAAFQNP